PGGRWTGAGGVQSDAADQSSGIGGPPAGGVVGDGDLGAGHVDRAGLASLADLRECPPQRGDPAGPVSELDLGGHCGTGELSGPASPKPRSNPIRRTDPDLPTHPPNIP